MTTRPEDLPGFQWMPGMRDREGFRVLRVTLHDTLLVIHDEDDSDSDWATLDEMGSIDHTDPGSEGCLLRLLGDEAWRVRPSQAWLEKDDGTIRHLTFRAFLSEKDTHDWPERVAVSGKKPGEVTLHDTLGAACIAVATARGCWPGGVQ